MYSFSTAIVYKYAKAVFTALRGMPAPTSYEKAVCPSVRLSNTCINRRKISSDFNTIRKGIWPSFLRRRMVGGSDPFYLKSWVKLTPLERNRRFSVDIR